MISNKFWKNRRVLLTGHTGFKGSWLLLWLKEMGAKVFCYSLPPSEENNLYKDLFYANNNLKDFCETFNDIRDTKRLNQFVNEAKPEVVFHLAAQPLVKESYRDPVNTWEINVMGSLFLLESLKSLKNRCSIVMVTTDKVYLNKESLSGYRETDKLGGHDPYSSSKAAAEIAIASWRSSFYGKKNYQNPNLRIATARAGNVIGGGDWAKDRIFPDSIKAISSNKTIKIRNPNAKRPWQHVLEPLSGYLILAEKLYTSDAPICEAFNFGPNLNSNKTVKELVEHILSIWPGNWEKDEDINAVHEATLLHLQIDKSYHILGWSPKWDFNETISYSTNWYKSYFEGESPLKICLKDIANYQSKK